MSKQPHKKRDNKPSNETVGDVSERRSMNATKRTSKQVPVGKLGKIMVMSLTGPFDASFETLKMADPGKKPLGSPRPRVQNKGRGKNVSLSPNINNSSRTMSRMGMGLTRNLGIQEKFSSVRYKSSILRSETASGKKRSSLLSNNRKIGHKVMDRVADRLRRVKPGGKSKRFQAQETSSVTNLQRGGVHIQTSVGAVQFGMPPETIKDVLSAGLDMPNYYVMPKERFNLHIGVSSAEVEFPMFYSFFLLQKKMTLITDMRTKKEVDIIVRESTIGPEEHYLYAQKEYQKRNSYMMPDHVKESDHFRVDEPELINYIYFDKDGVVSLQNEKKLVLLRDNTEEYVFELFDFTAFMNSGVLRKKTLKKYNLKGKSPVEIFKVLKDYRHAAKIEQFLRIISYNDTERIGNIYQNEDEGAVEPLEEEEEFDYFLEDFEPASKPLRKAAIENDQFKIPQFGITVLGNSHGFDPKGTTTGFVIWVNGHGVMVDPPPHSSFVLERYGIRPKSITAIILTHCHADHDAGTFQKMITDHKVDLITSATIYESFVRKYSAVSGLSKEFLNTLFRFRPVYLGEPNYWKGAVFTFFYSLHSIPCIGFKVDFKGQNLVYSSDTFYDTNAIKDLQLQGVLSHGRAMSLLNFPFDCDVVLHEAGVPPIHTPVESFTALPESQREKIHLIHIAGKEAAKAKEAGLKIAQPGVENSLILIPPAEQDGQMVKWLQIISSMEIFEHFSVTKALELVYMAEPKLYKKGEVLQGEGLDRDRFMIIASGMGLASISNCVRNLTEGDYFGELLFVKNSDLDSEFGGVLGTDDDKRESEETKDENEIDGDEIDENEIDENSFAEDIKKVERKSGIAPRAGNRTTVTSGAATHGGSLETETETVLSEERFVALTDMEVLELDFYAIKNLLVEDDLLKQKMADIVGARNNNYGWTAIESNQILRKLRLGQKLKLQSIMSKFVVVGGDVVKGLMGGDMVQWKAKQPVKFAILVDEGQLHVEGDSDILEGDKEVILEPGMLAFEYLHASNGENHEITLKAYRGVATVYAIEAEAFIKFMHNNPHLMLSFFKSELVV